MANGRTEGSGKRVALVGQRDESTYTCILVCMNKTNVNIRIKLANRIQIKAKFKVSALEY